jgi:hypothetical protein
VPKIVIQAAARNGWDDVHQRISDEGKFDNSLFGMEIARPLTDAAECGHLSTFKLILKIQNGRSTPGSRKMLPCVAMEGNLQVLDLALREGASLDQQLYVPLIAAMKGHKEMLVHSLDHGFHLDHEDPEHCSVTHFVLLSLIGSVLLLRILYDGSALVRILSCFSMRTSR